MWASKAELGRRLTFNTACRKVWTEPTWSASSGRGSNRRWGVQNAHALPAVTVRFGEDVADEGQQVLLVVTPTPRRPPPFPTGSASRLGEGKAKPMNRRANAFASRSACHRRLLRALRPLTAVLQSFKANCAVPSARCCRNFAHIVSLHPCRPSRSAVMTPVTPSERHASRARANRTAVRSIHHARDHNPYHVETSPDLAPATNAL